MPDLPADRVRAIESLVTDWLQEEDVPGASVVVFDADGERYAEGFGARNLETNDPATPDTLYGMGSITKSVTGLVVVGMAEAGELSLSDPVDDYVDHYEDAPGDPITIAELLSHTSGMPATGTGILDQALRGTPAGVSDEDDRKRYVRDATELRATDRERFMYYNTGYDILGRVIEAVDGRDYAEYVREEVFEPLGMERSTFHEAEFEGEEDAMTGYEPGEGPPEPAPFPFEELIHPSGGLVSSVRELSRFVRAAMNDGSLDGSRVVPSGTVERCLRERAVRRTCLDGRDQGYGYGWMRQEMADDLEVGHGGSIVVSTAGASYLQDAGLGVVVACNTTADPHPMELGRAVLAVAAGHPPTEEPTYAMKRRCEAVTGTYESYRGELTATVERDGGGLSVTMEGSFGEEELTAFPASLSPDDHEFYTVFGDGARALLEFDLDGDHADLFYTRARLRRVE
ncbi:serine hydrolase [Halobacteriales archaeon QS_8_69_26]|nr:MAG: serine hydrolase [Halobacteriales archaeon QS_8_69_26]